MSSACESKALFLTEAEIQKFVSRFEDRSLEAAEFTHAGHVALAAWYLLHEGPRAALARLRREIPAFQVAKGGVNGGAQGYHETLTVFWVAMVAQALRGQPSEALLPAVNRAVAQLGSSDLWRDYYIAGLPRSAEHRRQWIPPDRRPLPGEEWFTVE